jgi:hypothetical protein
MSDEYKYLNNPLIYPAAPIDFSGTAQNNDLGYHQAETTQRYIFGTRGITWDGRVYKYGHARAAVKSCYGAFNAGTHYGDYVVLPQAAAIGDRKILVTIDSSAGFAGDGALAKDELAGGYIALNNNTENAITRLIIGNDAVASGGGTSYLTLDAPIAYAALTVSSGSEITLNPYAHLSGSSNSYASVMGVPAVTCAATYNFWLQTWGPCWVTPGGGDASPGDTAGDRTMIFVGDGSVNGVYGGTIETGYQIAGFIIDETESGTSAQPLLMLQISI